MLLIIIAVIAVILLLTGGFVPSLQFLLWIGIVVALVCIVMYFMRRSGGRSRV